MERLLDTLFSIPEAKALAAAVDGGGCPAAVTGLGGIHRAQIASAVAAHLARPLVMVCTDEGEAERLASDLSILLGSGGRNAACSGSSPESFSSARGRSSPGSGSKIAWPPSTSWPPASTP